MLKGASWGVFVVVLALLFINAFAIERHAIVIGANDGGPQQEKLRFAESDAERMATVLRELGGFTDVKTLMQPRPTEVLAAIERVRASVFVLYYSGHANASSLSLGGEELALSTLRGRLEHVPADVRIVLLDACQSGAFARGKGASLAADFSYNATDGLNVTGTAVLASSSASELSQETDDAEGSFFTHHLVSALRGAADSDDDGRVTLDEAYRYTHSRTLEDTAKTRVGSQHVTFDTQLRGQGALQMTSLPRQRQRVRLGPELSGRVLLVQAKSGAVMADIKKAAGESFFVALPVGNYRASVRADDRAYACKIDVLEALDTTLETRKCTRVRDAALATKTYRSLVALELGVGVGQMLTDGYDARLRQFSYDAVGSRSVRFQLQGAVLVNVLPFLAVFAEAMMLEQARYRRDPTSYGWSAFGVAAGLRGTLWLLRDRVNPYVQLSSGIGLALTDLDGFREAVPGWLLHPAIGCNFSFSPHFGLFLQFDAYIAPILRNLMNETHQSGGVAGTVGLRVGL